MSLIGINQWYMLPLARHAGTDGGGQHARSNQRSNASVRAAGITRDGNLLDICCLDFFQGSGEPYAAIPLPWGGTQEELDDEVAEQTWDE